MNTMDCEGLRRLAAGWENGLDLKGSDLDSARIHAAACPSCAASHRAFLVLAQRDSSDRPSVSGIGPAADALADRVMEAIAAERLEPRRRSSSPLGRRRVPAFVFAAAVAAAAFAVGLGVRDYRTEAVRFTLEAPHARSVYLAGSFSSWGTSGLELKRLPDGTWERTVRLRRGRSYSYNFLVDGESWIVDPTAPERVEDGFGGESALLRL